MGIVTKADWLTPARIQRVSICILIAGVAAVFALIATSKAGLDAAGRPLGTDFANVWTAGKMALSGHAADAYSPSLHYAEQQATFYDSVPFYGWHYPPFFMLLAIILAAIPYSAAWLVWMSATLPAYLAMIWAISRHKVAMLAAAAFPAVFVNFIHGQNGFLTAALIGGAMICLNPRPYLAGVLIGLLAYKPQFGVLIPLALAAGGYWRSFAAAAATVVSMSLFSTIAFGPEIWTAFLESRHFTQEIVLEAGETGWEKIQSLFAAVRHLGGSLELAYAAQGTMFLGLGVCVVWMWRRAVTLEVKAAGLIVASLLATPYVMDYDLMALAPAIMLLTAAGLRDGFAPYEKAVLAFAWLAPAISRPIADAAMIPMGLIAMVLLFALIFQRALNEMGHRLGPRALQESLAKSA